MDCWDDRAKEHGESHWASWGDHYAIRLEVDTISKFINEGDKVLDVGCANGHATVQQLVNSPEELIGMDLSEEMIRYAENYNKDNVNFLVGDILNIPFDDCSFDVVYTTRVLINLQTWENQQRGMDECIRVAKPGGKIVFSECFYEPLVLLNSMRVLNGLPALSENDFNRYLKTVKMEAYLVGQDYERIDFSSVYFLGSRFLREIITNAEDYEGYSNPINGIFYDLGKRYSGGGFGVQRAYVITKGK